MPFALQARAARLTGRGWFWIAVVAVLFAAPMLRGLLQGRPPAPPPLLGSFPGFALIAERGGAFTDADLRRRAFIANLLCSSTDSCASAAGIARTSRTTWRILRDAALIAALP